MSNSFVQNTAPFFPSLSTALNEKIITELIYSCQFIINNQDRGWRGNRSTGLPIYRPKYVVSELREMIINAFEKRKDIAINGVILNHEWWLKWGRNEIKNEVQKQIYNKRVRIQKNQRLLKGFLKSSYLLVKWYKSTMEKMYHPDSLYVNTILKKNFEEHVLSLTPKIIKPNHLNDPAKFTYEQLI